jgi:DNA-binding protein HU-beta
MVMPAKRTTHRSSTGTKLYAVRDSKGRFKDIQTYKRAHAMDMKRTSKSEAAAKRKTGKRSR